MKRFGFLKFLLGFLLVAGAVLYVAPHFWSFEEYRNQVTTAIKNATGQNVILRGDIKVQFLPLPEVQVSDVYLSEAATEEGSSSVTSIKLIRARLKLLALLGGKTEIKAVTLVHPIATWDNIRNIRSHWNKDEKTATQESKKMASLITTSIEDGKIYFGDSRKRDTTKIENINASINTSAINGALVVKGSFLTSGNHFSFDADISATEKSGKGDSTWNFIGDGFKITFLGDLVGKEGDKNNTLSGVVEASSDDFDYIIARYFQQKNVKRRDEKEAKKEKGEDTAHPFSARGKLFYSNKLFKITDFIVSSEFISGNGDINISTARTIPDVDVSLVFENINVDKFIHNSYAEQVKNVDSGSDSAVTAEKFIAQTAASEDPYERISCIISGVAKEFNMLSEINIKRLTYNNQSVDKIIFDADVFNGDLVINEFTASLPGNSFFEVVGAMKHNAIRPRFAGEISLSGDSLRTVADWLNFSTKDMPESALGRYKLNSDIVLLPQKINLSGIDLSVDKTRGSGSVIMRYGDVSPKVISNLHIDHLDLDSYHLSSQLIALIQTYYKGDDKNSQSKNFNWLRGLGGQVSGELTLGDVSFNKVNYREVSSLFSVSPGKLRIEKLYVDSSLLKFSSSVDFDITAIRPKIDFQLDADTFDMSAFDGLQQPATDKADAGKNTAAAGHWPSEPFYSFGLGRFDGKLRMNAKSFKYHTMTLNDLVLNLRLSEGLIGFDTFTGKYTTGNIIIRGILNIEDIPNLAVSFALNNVELGQFFKDFTNVDSISGYTSIGGSVVTYGNSYADWVKNAKSSVAVVGRAIKVSHFGLHDLISKSEDVTTAKQLNDIAASAAAEGTTLFDTAETQLQISAGMLDFSGMKLTTTRTSGVMSGRVDLVNWLMNMTGQFAFIALDNDATVNLGFNAVGAVDSPKKSFDLSNLFKNKGMAVTPQN